MYRLMNEKENTSFHLKKWRQSSNFQNFIIIKKKFNSCNLTIRLQIFMHSEMFTNIIEEPEIACYLFCIFHAFLHLRVHHKCIKIRASLCRRIFVSKTSFSHLPKQHFEIFEIINLYNQTLFARRSLICD